MSRLRVESHRRRYMAVIACHALLAWTLTGCGKSTAPPAAPEPAASTSSVSDAASTGHAVAVKVPAALAPAPAASTATETKIEIVQLALGTAIDSAHKITTTGTRFAPGDKTLYASVDTRGQTANATLNARWRYLEGDGQLISSINQSIAAEGPATTTFTLHNPDLWPEGKYEIDISLDGVPVIQRHFEIANP